MLHIRVHFIYLLNEQHSTHKGTNIFSMKASYSNTFQSNSRHIAIRMLDIKHLLQHSVHNASNRAEIGI